MEAPIDLQESICRNLVEFLYSRQLFHEIFMSFIYEKWEMLLACMKYEARHIFIGAR